MPTLYTSTHHQISCAQLQYFKRGLHSIAPTLEASLGLPGKRAFSAPGNYTATCFTQETTLLWEPLPLLIVIISLYFDLITSRPKESGYKPSLFLHYSPFLSQSPSYYPVSLLSSTSRPAQLRVVLHPCVGNSDCVCVCNCEVMFRHLLCTLNVTDSQFRKRIF